jgi:hypothetical protein
MAEAEGVRRLPQQLPEQLTISGTPDLRMTPNQIRALKAATGKTLEQLMGPQADDGDRMQAIAWLELRRLGFEVDWEEAGDVPLQFETEEPDPTSGGSSSSSPPSAITGE